MSDYEGMIQTNYLGDRPPHSRRHSPSCWKPAAAASSTSLRWRASPAARTWPPTAPPNMPCSAFPESLDLEYRPDHPGGRPLSRPCSDALFPGGRSFPALSPHRSPGGSSIRNRSPPRHRSHRSTAGSRGAAHLRTRPRFPGPLPRMYRKIEKAVCHHFNVKKRRRNPVDDSSSSTTIEK